MSISSISARSDGGGDGDVSVSGVSTCSVAGASVGKDVTWVAGVSTDVAVALTSLTTVASCPGGLVVKSTTAMIPHRDSITTAPTISASGRLLFCSSVSTRGGDIRRTLLGGCSSPDLLGPRLASGAGVAPSIGAPQLRQNTFPARFRLSHSGHTLRMRNLLPLSFVLGASGLKATSPGSDHRLMRQGKPLYDISPNLADRYGRLADAPDVATSGGVLLHRHYSPERQKGQPHSRGVVPSALRHLPVAATIRWLPQATDRPSFLIIA
jgi:hypothetical protein